MEQSRCLYGFLGDKTRGIPAQQQGCGLSERISIIREDNDSFFEEDKKNGETEKEQ